MNRLPIFLSLTNALLVSFAAPPAANEPKSADKPNIVFVLFDDLGWCQPPSYWEHTQFKMPNLDRLVHEGMRFTDAHSASAVCTPTRYGVITGRYPWRIGQFGVLTTYSPPIIPRDRLTIASLLKQHGYRTACVGKWHLGMDWECGKPGTEKSVPVGAKINNGPNALGFDYFCGFTHARNIGTVIEQDTVVANVAPEENQPLMIQKALAWIEQQAAAGQPFFLYFPMCPPHEPVVPSSEYIGKSGAKDTVRGDPKYGDWIYQGDAMLGQILDALERHKLAENTLLIAASDNGAEQRPYPPLRESKRSIYEGGHRVPFVARWPGKIKPGSVNNNTICLNDLMATAAEILGVRLPDNAAEDSVSILPELLGKANGPAREATVHQSMAGDLAIRQGPWKLIFFTDGRRELYNLESDLPETNDLAGRNPQVVERLTKLMQRYIDQGRSTPGAPQKNGAPVSLSGSPVRKRKATSQN
jgi:arylsulfatase A-like enzyme